MARRNYGRDGRPKHFPSDQGLREAQQEMTRKAHGSERSDESYEAARARGAEGLARAVASTDEELLNWLYWGIAFLALYCSPFLASDLVDLLHIPLPEGKKLQASGSVVLAYLNREWIRSSGTERGTYQNNGQPHRELELVPGARDELMAYCREHRGTRPAWLPKTVPKRPPKGST